MDANRVAEIKANLSSKDTSELLEIWKANDREAYTDDAFEAIRLLLEERSVAPPPQSTHVPRENRPEYYQWDMLAIKRTRAIYLTFFLLMIAANIGGVFVQSIGPFVGNIVSGLLFLVVFMGVARKVLHYSIGSIIGLSIVILFIPFVSLLVVASVDRKVYIAIKKKKELGL